MITKNTFSISAIAIAIALSFTACSKKQQSGTESFDPGKITTNAATKSASAPIERTLGSVISGVDETVVSGTAGQTVLPQSSTSTSSSRLGALSSMIAASQGRIAKTRQEREEEVNRRLQLFLANPEREDGSSRILYHPDSKAICAEQAPKNPAACIEAYQRITIEQKLTSETEGELKLMFDELNPLSFSYATDTVAFDVRLADTKTTVERIFAILNRLDGGTLPNEIPVDIKGLARLTLKRASEEASSAQLGIPEGFSLKTTHDPKDPVTVELGATEKIIKLAVDHSEKSVGLEVGLASVMAAFNAKDGLGAVLPLVASAAGLTGKLEISEKTKTIAITGLGLLGQSAFLKADGMTALEAKLSDLDALIDLADKAPTLSFKTALSAFVYHKNVRGFMDAGHSVDGEGSLSFSATAATVLQPAPGGTGVKVAAGSFQVIGTGVVSGSVSIAANACFASAPSAPGPQFPFVASACQ